MGKCNSWNLPNMDPIAVDERPNNSLGGCFAHLRPAYSNKPRLRKSAARKRTMTLPLVSQVKRTPVLN
jgi:hypothetical protein